MQEFLLLAGSRRPEDAANGYANSPEYIGVYYDAGNALANSNTLLSTCLESLQPVLLVVP